MNRREFVNLAVNELNVFNQWMEKNHPEVDDLSEPDWWEQIFAFVQEEHEEN